MKKYVSLLITSLLVLSACDTSTPAPNAPTDETSTPAASASASANASNDVADDVASDNSLTIGGTAYTLKEANVRYLGGNIEIDHGKTLMATSSTNLKDGEALLMAVINGDEVLAAGQAFDTADIKRIERFRIKYKENGEVKEIFKSPINVPTDAAYKWTGQGTGDMIMGTIESLNAEPKVKYTYKLDMN